MWADAGEAAPGTATQLDTQDASYHTIINYPGWPDD